jgi:predicted nucleic acid-binding protein
MRLYLETTIFNYYFDTDRDGHADVVQLFDEIRKGKYEAYTSRYALLELQDASEPKRSKMLALIDEYEISVFPASPEVDRMAALYISEEIIPPRFQDDSAHIAVASVNGLDCILSYNFQHINRLKTKLMTERINHREGYNGIVICTAREVLDDEQIDE